MKKTRQDSFLAALVFGLCAILFGCERPPMEVEQRNYRGLGIEDVTNPRIEGPKLAANVAPEPLPPAQSGTPPATAIFKNLQVLGDLESAEFTRLMAAITSWVSPQQGCLYCHDGNDFAKDYPYTKIVSRRMLQMTRYINSEWKDHVKSTGVTCYTCHRGNPVPANYWTIDEGSSAHGLVGYTAGQNAPGMSVGGTSLPSDPFQAFLLGQTNIRVQGTSALPMGNRSSIKQTEWTYGLMMHMSTSLGVNCTYCHNSRSFSRWDQSAPPRSTAWYGIRMVRHLNDDYLQPLASVFPANRKGPAGDSFKINCATCHQGLAKPLMGVSMAKDYPELARLEALHDVELGALEADPGPSED